MSNDYYNVLMKEMNGIMFADYFWSVYLGDRTIMIVIVAWDVLRVCDCRLPGFGYLSRVLAVTR